MLKIGRLKPHDADAREIGQLLSAAHRNLDDAHIMEISAENRYDAAYKAVMQAALAALMAHGYRPDTNQPGHHATVIQSLPKTIGSKGERVAVLDTLRHKRNLSDYTGKDIDPASVEVCIKEAATLLKEVEAWIAQHRPDLVPKNKERGK
ncbi:MAG TPA: DNA-binding protein [Burkholderiales bacterium]|nr:DNA-binding protein [Burkholderiales bacterium]